MNAVPGARVADQELAQAALAALRRAGLRAAEEARRSNTLMVISEGGRLVHVSALDYVRMSQEALESTSVGPLSPSAGDE